MPDITDSVGAGGKNAIHDVAMVQLMLKLLTGSQRIPYFAAGYTSRYGVATDQALVAFQADHGLARRGAPPGSSPGGSAETPGLVKRGSPTWQALLKEFGSVDARYRTARTTEGFALAYVPMADSRLHESVSAIHGAKNLQSEFRQKVVRLVQIVFSQSGIAWSVVPQTGGWRSFAGQEGLVSDAGYGESIHQYGFAVDLTVANFSWFDSDLRVHKSPISLSGMDRSTATQLYAARNKVGDTLKLFSTTKSGDLAHLQNFDDDTLDSVSSLIALMQKVGPHKMKWKPQFRTPTNYLCDLGLGGDYFFVGTAVDIWKQDATRRISAADLAKALADKKKRDAKFSADAFFGRTGAPRAHSTDVGESDIRAVQKMLRAEFDAAAANWKQWTPVKYPSSERRPANPAKR